MKICMIIEAWKPFYGGGQSHTWELVKSLVNNHGCEINLYTRRLSIKGNSYKNNESLMNGKLKVFRSGITSNYNSFIGRISWVLSVVFKNLSRKYDIIHGQPNLAGLPTKILGIINRTPTVFSIQGSGLLFWDEMSKGLTSRINHFVELVLQTKIKYSKEITDSTVFCDFKNVNKAVVIHNGVEIERFDKVKVDKSRTGKFKVLFVGRLHSQKGIKYLIQAVKKVKKDLSDSEIHIVGSGELEQELRASVKQEGLDEIIKFRGEVFGKELVKEYKSAHLFILPSLFEGQPLTVFEAWASKTPVLSTMSGENPVLIKEGVNGWLVPVKDSDMLGEKLKYLKELPRSKLESVGKNGYELVKREYSWDKMAKKIFRVYKSIIKN